MESLTKFCVTLNSKIEQDNNTIEVTFEIVTELLCPFCHQPLKFGRCSCYRFNECLKTINDDPWTAFTVQKYVIIKKLEIYGTGKVSIKDIKYNGTILSFTIEQKEEKEEKDHENFLYSYKTTTKTEYSFHSTDHASITLGTQQGVIKEFIDWKTACMFLRDLPI